MATPLLGDYNCEEVVVTFKGLIHGLDFQPSQFGTEERVGTSEQVRAEDVEGQGGGTVISHQHSRTTDFTMTLMPTDPSHKILDDGALLRERWEVTVVDNSGTDCKMKATVWLRAKPGFVKGRVATEMQWSFRGWVHDMQHGQTNIIAAG